MATDTHPIDVVPSGASNAEATVPTTMLRAVVDALVAETIWFEVMPLGTGRLGDGDAVVFVRRHERDRLVGAIAGAR